MANAYAQRLRLRLFLEGVEVPVISANVQCAPNSPMIASIQVPPLPEGTRLMPRTLVHLFFLDDFESKVPQLIGSNKRTNGANNNRPTEYQRDLDRFDDTISQLAESGGQSNSRAFDNRKSITQYKLLFGGEMIGFVWNKNEAQRSLVLQCQDWSNYWDYAYQYTNTSIFGPGKKVMFSGGATNLFTDFLSTKGSIITQIVASGRCNSFPELKGLAAGIIRLLEAIGGTYYPNPRSATKKRLAGQNIFFSTAELRLHITHMIAAYEDDPTSQRLLRRQGWTRLFNRALGGLGGQVSIRKAINALQAIIFHETYAQPCPYYRPGLDGTVSGQRRVRLDKDPEFGFIARSASQIKEAVDAIRQSLSEATPDSVDSTGGLTEYRTTIRTRLRFTKREISLIQANGSTRKAPALARSLLGKASRYLASAQSNVGQWRPNAPESQRNKTVEPLRLASLELQRLQRLTINTTPKGKQSPARLNQHILRPDIWFGAPPRCNVIFPENYDSLTYQRMFLTEPTRLMLKTNDEFFGEDFLFDKFYFAPQAGSLKKDQARLRDMLRRDLLDHELFTGILPVFEKMGEFNVFAAQSGTQRQYNKVGFAQRSANFLYFKYRFNSRQMRVSGKFNPHIACGFPGLILDKYVDLATVRLHNELREKQDLPPQEIAEALGTNFLGNFTEVTHRVSQAEPMGRTEISCSYPRQPEESVEFLGTTERAQTVRRKVGDGALRATDVAAISAPRLYSLGPNGGRIVQVNEVTDAYAFFGTGDREGQELPLFRSGTRRQGRVKMPLVPIGVVTSARALGSEDVAEIVGDIDREVRFRAFRVEEEIPRYRRESVDIPAEELIRPGWYGDIWTPSKIGKVYDDFFGTGSITDPQTVTDSFFKGTRISDEVQEQASDEAAAAQSQDDPRLDVPAVTQLDEESSIQDAVEFLLLTYSYIRQNNLNLDEFIKAYTWRPVASMVDIFGTTDLEFTSDGHGVVRGVEGFHSRAFGPYDDLFGLVTPEIESILGIKRGSNVAQKGDTRKRKQEKVLQFSSALQFSRAILG